MVPFMEEKVEWKGSPSQLLNLGVFLFCLLLAGGVAAAALILVIPLVWAGMALPALVALWSYLTVRCRVYELTSQRLRKYEGVLNQTIDELELYRVKDITMERPFWFRIFGLSTVVVLSSDRTHPEVRIEAVRDAFNLRDTLRRQVEFWRDRKRVREVDFDGAGGESLDLL